MAKIGLNNFRYSILTEAPDGTPSYNGATKPARAISCSVSITNNEAKLYADDVLAETDTSFQSGQVTMGIDDEDLATMAALLGHDYSDEAGLIRSSMDTAPWVGIGRVVVKMINGVYKYKVEFLYKVKFAEPNQDDTTKGESLAFGTSELEGQVATLADGTWSIAKVFDTQDAAITFLEGLMASSQTSATVTYNVNGGTGTVAAVSTYVGARITLNDGSSITPPAGKVFLGWDTTSTSTTADCRSPYTVTGSVTLYAIYATE